MGRNWEMFCRGRLGRELRELGWGLDEECGVLGVGERGSMGLDFGVRGFLMKK
ncbi:unnamed protein product [Moneuplotes crassus]|uniref:Uncharacterized protein n=1 Tax=Euplotes crassus TaxID=5936 RepID=A0AAD1XX08_EUPCR|nr:unnamed protein product [Moneuplotes crassus]